MLSRQLYWQDSSIRSDRRALTANPPAACGPFVPAHHPRGLEPPNGDPAHAGTSTTTQPDEMWGSPCAKGCGTPSAAFAKDVARGLRIRCDSGPQHIADAWINELKW